MAPSIVIVLAGAHGVGKSTHARGLSHRLAGRMGAEDVALFQHRAPPSRFSAHGKALHYAAQRQEFLGVCGARVVVADRWVESTLAAAAACADGREAEAMRSLALEELLADRRADRRVKWVVLDAPSDVLNARLVRRHGRDTTPAETLEASFLRAWPGVRVDASRAPEDVAAAIDVVVEFMLRSTP